MKKVKIKCKQCGKRKSIAKAEHSRQIRKGRLDFFCSLSCAASNRNAAYRCKEITKVCPKCGKQFGSTTSVKAATFCSRSCASAGSVTDYRREQAKRVGGKNLERGVEHSAKGLGKREAWKYVELADWLASKNVRHQFEYPIREAGVFDLALIAEKVLIEFDGRYHREKQQKVKDEKKMEAAAAEGWQVIRVETAAGVIPVDVLEVLDFDRLPATPLKGGLKHV